MVTGTGSEREFRGAVVGGTAPDLGLPLSECVTTGPLEPCTIVIFGASGDLTARKLVPSLYNLFVHDSLPRPFTILGCARTSMGDEEFRVKLRGAFPEAPARWEEFAGHLFYQALEYDSVHGYVALAGRLRELDRERGTGGNRVFYAAVPPDLYSTVTEMIGRQGLAREREDGNGWSRIVVEKPFGRDLPTAMELDGTLHRSFGEHQIFRIDHYLAKETVQNVLMLRFANAIFEPLWNRNFVDHVGILAAETLGVEHRAGYYDRSGVLRDMFQNHLMQLLALIAMEAPSRFESDRVQDEKAKLFRSLKPLTAAGVHESLILGQYGPGAVEGTQIPGYREEPGVRPDSVTPTFAVLRLFLDNWRWQGVPFYLTSGKRLARKVTEITVQFKEVPHSMFQRVLGERIIANRLIVGIYPDEGIRLTFQTKNPGAQMCLRSVLMDFKYYEDYRGPVLDAYDKALVDCIQGDHMLFWRQDGVELCWAFLTPILEECEACGPKVPPIHPYEAGTWGPDPARAWMRMMLNQ